MDDLATTSDLAPRRARSMAEMGALFATLFERDAIRATIEGFRPRPTDVIISPFAKCGTTWLQQTFHCPTGMHTLVNCNERTFSHAANSLRLVHFLPL